MLHQIRNLTASQCRQLGVGKAYNGAPALKAVMAWLGDSQLYGENSEPLDVEQLFAEGDPAEVMLYSGMATDAEEDAVSEEAAEEAAPAEAVEADMQAAVRRGVQQAMQKSQRTTGLPTSIARVTSNLKKSDNFQTVEGQYLAGQWIGAKIFKQPDAIKWWSNNAPSGLKAQSEGTNSAGGFLVPDPLEAAILDVREIYGVCRKVARTFPMTADTLNVPSLTSGSTVYYPAENASITESSAVWANVGLTATKRACLMKWSNELGADALFSLAETLSDYMGRALGIREDTEFIQGDGTAAFGSVTGLGNVAGRGSVDGGGATWSDLTLANLISVIGTLPDKFHAGASWIMSRQFYSQVVLRVIADGGGNTIDTLGLGAGDNGVQILGYPVNFSDQAPIATAPNIEACYFGNFMDATVFGDRSGIEIATSDQVGFIEDQMNIRATSRYDIQTHDASAYVCLSTT